MKRWLVIGMVLAVVVLLGVVGFYFLGQGDEPEISASGVDENSAVLPGQRERRVTDLRNSFDGSESAPEPVSERLRVLADSTADLHDRVSVAHQLKNEKEPRAFETFVHLLRNVSERDTLRYVCAHGAAATGGEKAIPHLVEAARFGENSYNVRAASLIALGHIGSAVAVDSLSEFVEDDDPLIRVKALDGLEKADSPLVVRHAINRLNDSDADVRDKAIRMIGQMGNASHVQHIVAVLRSNDDVFIGVSCIGALGSLGGDDARIVLEEYTRNPNELLSGNAMRELRENWPL